MKPFACKRQYLWVNRLRLYIEDFTWPKISGGDRAGTVMVNEVVYTHALAQTPWGGVKQSGYGRTHGQLGLLEFQSPPTRTHQCFPGVPDVWWFRYSQTAGDLFRGLAKRFTTGSLLQGLCCFRGC